MKALRWIRNNIDLKIWAVIIAFLVWFHVATERTYDANYLAKLEFVNPPKGWTVVGEPPEEIILRLRGTGKQLISHRLYGEPLATVELPKEKDHQVPVELKPGNILLARKGNVEIVHVVSPSNFSIEMDTLARKQVQIVTNIEGKPKEGFVKVDKPAVDPHEVELVGGRSSIRKIVELRTEVIDIRGEARTLERMVAVSLPPGAGFRSKPDSVLVIVEIERVVERSFEGVRVQVTDLAEGKSATVSPQTAVVKLSGPESIVSSADTSKISVSLDLSGLEDGPYVLPPRVTRPEQFEVISVEPELFSVSIE